jgi:hypothetical protein
MSVSHQLENGTGKPATFLANVASNTLSWSPDGTFILFDTANARRLRNSHESIDTAYPAFPRRPVSRSVQGRDATKHHTCTAGTAQRSHETRPSSFTRCCDQQVHLQPRQQQNLHAKAVQVVFEEIRKRLSLLPVGLDVNYQTISPDGKWVAMVANAANQSNIYIYSLDELSRDPAVAKQLTSTAGSKSSLQFTADSKELFFIENGRIGVVNLEGRNRSLAVNAEMDRRFFTRETRGLSTSVVTTSR